MPRSRLVPPGLLALAVLVLWSPSSARGPEERCLREKIRVASTGASGLLRCAVDAEDAGPAFARCVSRHTARTEHRLQRVEQKFLRERFDCPADAPALGLAGPAAWPASLLTTVGAEGTRRCRADLSRTARRYSTAYSTCVRRESASLSPAAIDACAVTPRNRFVAEWSRVAASGGCSAEDAFEVAARIEGEVDESAGRLRVECGDGDLGGFEECDDGGNEDGDGCSADCRIETCGRADGEVRCLACPADSVPDADWGACRCPDGFEGEPGSCTDINECASGADPCAGRGPCVNLAGTFACAIECSADAFHAALAECGGPGGAIAFDCENTTIRLPAGEPASLRDVRCDGLVVDGAGRGIAFELDPLCWRSPVDPSDCPGGLDEEGGCRCPDIDSGDAFLLLRGDRNVVRDLTVRGFFDGIPARGRDNVVERVRFERLCDDAFGSVSGGVGNVFRDLVVRQGCDKCSENAGTFEETDSDPRVPRYWHATMERVDFEGCRTPVRIATSGRVRVLQSTMRPGPPGFPCDGPRVNASAGGWVEFLLEDSLVDRCRRGVRIGRRTEATISGSRITGCSLRGVRVTGGGSATIEGSTIDGNGGGGSTESGFGGVAVVGDGFLDLGGNLAAGPRLRGPAPSGNTICGNRGPDALPRDIDNATETPVLALGNWWCATRGPEGRVIGPAEIDPVLGRAPLRGPRR